MAIEITETLKLYGVTVKAIDYSKLKKITDTLVSVTFVDTNQRKAQRRAVELAQDALGQMRIWNNQESV